MSTGLFSDEEDGYNLEETKFKLKVGDGTPSPAVNDLDGLEDVDGDSEFGSFDDVEDESNDKPFDDEPFDAGVEADEDTDPEKYIQQLAGKLGQSLRKYSEDLGQPDFDLEKFAINSLISATHTSEMDSSDQKDIIDKIKSAGNQGKDVDVDVNVNTNGEDANVEDSNDENGDPNDVFDEEGVEENKNRNFNMVEQKINDKKKIGRGLHSDDKGSNFVGKDNILRKLKEHHDMNYTDFGKYDSEEYLLDGPDISEAPDVAPAPVKPQVEPDIKPSRRSKPWRPTKQPKINPKADEGNATVVSEGGASNGRIVNTKYLDGSRAIITINLDDNEVDLSFTKTDELISEPTSIGEPWVYAYESTDSPDSKTYRVGVKFFGDPEGNMEVAGLNDEYIDNI